MKGLPVFPIAAIVVVLAGVGYAIINASGDDGDSQAPLTATPFPAGVIDVVIYNPQPGAVVSNPVTVEMAVGGAFLYPAGDTSDPTGGHLHVFIDRPPPGHRRNG